MIICANEGTWKCDNAANMTTAKQSLSLNNFPTLAAPTLTQFLVECRNALIFCVGILKSTSPNPWHLIMYALQSWRFSWRKRVIILVDNFCLCTRLREIREKNETTYYFIYTLRPSIPFLSFLYNVGPRHPVNWYFF